ncbi:MAG: GNAT family N-acetyltransferase, partial [Rhodobacter sp.]
MSAPVGLAAVDALLARSYPRLLAPDYPPSVLMLALVLISRAGRELPSSGTCRLAQNGRGRIPGAG